VSDIVIKPGMVSRSPFFVSKKPAEFKQTVFYRGTEDFCHVEFPMSQPWLYVIPQQATIGGENDRGVRHLPIKIFVQPMHPSFPKQKDITAEIKVNCRTPSGRRALSIPIYLQDVQPIKDFEGVIAMDFGTSSTCVAYIEHHDGSATVKSVPFTDDGWPPKFDSVGSLLYFADHTNPAAPDYEIGTSAVQAWRGSGGNPDEDKPSNTTGDAGAGPSDDAPLSAFKYSVKRYLGTGRKTYVLNNRVKADMRPAFYDYEQLCAFVIQRVLAKTEDHLGRKIKQLVATYPTTFTTTQLEALKRAFGSVGFPGDALNLAYDEANAVTLDYFNQRLANNSVLVLKAVFPPPSYILTFDFGGGTLDITIIQLDIREAGPTHEIQTQVIGVAGARQFAGDNISLVLFKVLKATIALFIAESGSEPGDVENIDAYRGQLEDVRQEVETIRKRLASGQELTKEQEDKLNALLPTRYDPSSEGSNDRARRHFFELWDVAEAIKKKFGTPDKDGKYPDQVALDDAMVLGLARIAEYSGVPFDQAKDEIVIKRGMYEPIIAKPIRDALEKAKRLVPASEPLALAILSGNSSRLPIVRAMAQEILGLEPRNIHFDPEGCKVAVARGAAFARRNELVPTRIKYKLGNLLKSLPWDLGCRVGGAPFECFFERGTELPSLAPYVFVPPTETTILHLFSRLSKVDEKPEEIGYFDFSRPPAGRQMPPEVLKAVKAGQARQKQVTLGRKKKPDDPQLGKPITVWIDQDRQIFAEKDGKSFGLTYQNDDFPDDVNPYSGVH
jgi:molecular chaperone DnaK (HSP70)